MGSAVDRTTWRTSLPVNGPGDLATVGSISSLRHHQSGTPALVGVPVDVQPSLFGTEKSAWAPYDVGLERESVSPSTPRAVVRTGVAGR